MAQPKLRFKREDGTEFPEWEETSLGDSCSGFEYGMNTAACSYDGTHKYIRITDIDDTSRRYLSDNAVSPSGNMQDKYIVKANDILFARTGASVGKAYLYKESDGLLYYAGFLIRANVNDDGNAYFVFSQTLTSDYSNWVKLTSMRTGQQGINAQEYKSYKFYAPCLEEQQKIADFLSTIDEVIAQSEVEVRNLEQQKKDAMQKIFLQEVRFRSEDGTEFPEWEEKIITELCESILGGGTPATENKDYWNGDIAWVSSSDLDNNDIHHMSITRFITEEAIRCSATKKIPRDSVLIVSRVGVGKVGVAPCELCTSQDFTNIVKPKCNSLFLGYMLSIIMQIKANGVQGTSIKGVTTKEIKQYRISIPCLEEQQKIADFLSAYDEAITYAKQELDKWKELKKGLLQQMFV